LDLPAPDYSVNEGRDELKKPKGRISDLENRDADAGMVYSRRCYHLLKMLDNNERRWHPLPKISLFRMNDEMIGNDRLDQELEDEKDAVGGIEMKPRQETKDSG
jgi:hypothetical protein